MSVRSLSVAALGGSLATLVLVATLAGAGDATPQPAPERVAQMPVIETAAPIKMPTSRAIHRFVREQTQPRGVMLASFER